MIRLGLQVVTTTCLVKLSLWSNSHAITVIKLQASLRDMPSDQQDGLLGPLLCLCWSLAYIDSSGLGAIELSVMNRLLALLRMLLKQTTGPKLCPSLLLPI